MIIDLALREGIQIKEGQFSKKDMYSAEEVFITNTTMEVMPASKVDDQRFDVGNGAKFFRTIYQQEVNAYIAEVRAKGPSSGQKMCSLFGYYMLPVKGKAAGNRVV